MASLTSCERFACRLETEPSTLVDEFYRRDNVCGFDSVSTESGQTRKTTNVIVSNSSRFPTASAREAQHFLQLRRHLFSETIHSRLPDEIRQQSAWMEFRSESYPWSAVSDAKILSLFRRMTRLGLLEEMPLLIGKLAFKTLILFIYDHLRVNVPAASSTGSTWQFRGAVRRPIRLAREIPAQMPHLSRISLSRIHHMNS